MKWQIVAAVATFALAGCRGSPDRPEVAPSAAGAPATPEEALRRIEETIAAAKTVRIRCRCEQIVRNSSGLEDRFVVDGAALLKDEGKVLLAFKGMDSEGDPRGVQLVSDGARVSYRLGYRSSAQELGLPGGFRPAVQQSMCRFGLPLSALVIATRIQSEEDKVDLSAPPRLSDFARGEEDATSASFTYRVADASGKIVSGKLWYEKGTFRPLKRIVRWDEGGQALSFVETYVDYVLGAEVPDAMFILPGRRTDPSDVARTRRWASDTAGWTILVERLRGRVVFVLLAAPGATLTETGAGVEFKRGTIAMDLTGSQGLMLSGKGGFSSYAIPEGWDRDLVQEYRDFAASHPEAAIRPWLLDEVRRRQSPAIDQFLQKE